MIRVIDYKIQIDKIDLGFGVKSVGRKSFSCTIESDVCLSLGQKFDHDNGSVTFCGILPLNALLSRTLRTGNIFIHDCTVDDISINESKTDVPKTLT
jgi:hypothetical protein